MTVAQLHAQSENSLGICVSEDSPGDSECVATTRNHPYPCHNRKIQGAYEKSNGYKLVIVSLGGGDGHSVPGLYQKDKVR